ncbi:hypothetical protein B0F90DRAFT_1708679 [Multifurca ochricompacta]|uniref:Uncharacterized protein n=1 Tax=Multifurca ochricompacta TaxID=376703 RepID=A0AAD4QNM8_9AGAM|nr:hypothetical protein B0F90DRAFT_1708679 [Multifurca ochricompacta]
MSPSKKRAKNIKVHVPRHNSQRIGPALTAQIEALAKEKRIRTDVRQPTNEISSAIALAIESASEWNSMLLTARAERGPQWDVAHNIDEGSHLYCDPSPLLEYQKEDKHGTSNVASENLPSTSSNPLPPNQRAHHFPVAGHHSSNGVGMSPIVGTPTRHGIPGQMGGSYPGGPQFSAIPPAHFYGSGDRGSPMVTRGMGVGMGMDGMGITPDVRSLSRRI